MNMKYVYHFEEGSKEMKNLLGNKGAQLSEMTKIGIPVPPGFIISTRACVEYLSSKKINDEIVQQVKEAMKKLEESTRKKFGSENNPLLISVRSGAPISMPGMMDTILNLGLTDEIVENLAKTTNEWFAYDTYRRFIQMFGSIVNGIDENKFEKIIEEEKKRENVKKDQQLSVNALKRIIMHYKEIVDVPPPEKQLFMAIEAVFKSWNNERAINYRRLNNLPNDLGTGVVIQAMVFGNLGNDSCTGIVFTRNPANGKNNLYGEFLLNAQGEDIVSGKRTPLSIEKMKDIMPEIYDELNKVAKNLEKHYKDMQDIEFTVEKKKLYILQTRTAKRTGMAAVNVAVDMVKEGIIKKEEAVLKITPNQIEQLLHNQIDPLAKKKEKAIAKGLAASPGAAFGAVVFTADDTKAYENTILVRPETSPEDIEGIHVAQGILTSRGGLTSHAAVVARGIGKPCVVGCSEIFIDEEKKQFVVGDRVVREGDVITIDGTTGEIYIGILPVVKAEFTGNFSELMNWAKEFKKLEVRANADNPEDAEISRDFGAEGIGLCRTEHMFFKEERIRAIREMILADSKEERKKALSKIEPYQKEDFKEIFRVMNGLPVTIRLLDPPLHEFLPKEEKEIKELASFLGVDESSVREKIENISEFNPMLGFRGCRLGVKYPEINEMQARAIFKAMIESKKEGIKAIPEIEVPLVGDVKELVMIKKIIEKAAEELNVKRDEYKIGTMIEVPRAALTSDEIAREADFFSFGTNDLTQLTCGFSRDDAGKFLPLYVEKGIYEKDPFQSIDKKGVGSIMKICVEKARNVKQNIEIGICGEHGGDPDSIEFCHKIGLNSISCSPYRVPVAIISAAQASLRHN
ncbi:MAG: pyruvate, phosphate dikinase [Thermoplasmata archaeon]|nr:MAG: pyruvate, phosphate dikinase [Thermoplasmata archaeon]